ncbi:polysaccharide deacetylase family protein [Pontibacter diazotrophicus]|uniref:Polysaccharide deacetylase family protein n=1 Tax=Pontibacter diazotrophicus TaxID=1400979 RepID=A0A3D8LH03_9BACT|nr:polysaccharide deacetylase family protein [Pontibacter diazotrophicus]RDV16710.1 polysaccharide deacetylase family protein [Pontibacter diazotrophicus]
MKAQLRHIYYKYIAPKALVLMYHRVAEPESDVWEVAVSSANFEQQLQVLKQYYRVVPLKEMVERLKNGVVERNTIAITFDDGYVDNYQTAKPLLEKYCLPATFFITSGNVGQQKEFWWDELEHLILFSESLPAVMDLEVAGASIAFNLEEEAQLTQSLRQQHKAWKSCEQEPPSKRSLLFYRLWEKLKPLPVSEQQAALQKIRDWAGAAASARPDCRSMSREELKDLGQGELFDLGAHTVSHAALAYHAPQFQEKEIEENKCFLEEIAQKRIDLLTYPYGNYNNETMAIAERVAFAAAFTTEEKAVIRNANRYRLGRFQVKNMAAPEFKKQLQLWKYSI